MSDKYNSWMAMTVLFDAMVGIETLVQEDSPLNDEQKDKAISINNDIEELYKDFGINQLLIN
jgi:hypothetical protein